MLRFDAEAGVAARAANDVEREAPTAPDDKWIRFAPVYVPLSGAAVLMMAFLIWSAVL
jgi:hypothetical protein